MTDVGSPEGLPGLDLAALEAFLAGRPELGPTPTGPLTARLIAGGRSNLTYLVGDGTREWVLRRPPLGHVLATAHDMAREYRVMSALAATAVPVPAMVGLYGPEALGAPFYLMEHVAGVVLRTREQLTAIPPGQARALAAGLAETLAALHAVDADAVGLGDLGRPEGFLGRQVRTWRRQLEASRTREVPGLEELADRLAATAPPTTRPAIVHGDYRLDNVLVRLSSTAGPDEPPGIAAVLDWEMATRGDALADVAGMLAWWGGIAGLDSPVAAVPAEMPGFPGADFLLERYCAAAGESLTWADLAWHRGLAYYKLAAIFEGIHYRHTQGLTVGEGFELIGALTAPMVERGLAALAEPDHSQKETP